MSESTDWLGAPDVLLPSSWTSGEEGVIERPLVWWTSLVIMLTTLVIPILAVQVPPLTDYPNHLARCYVLAYGKSDPVLNQMFSAHWQIIPNIAVDLILPPLMHVFSPFTAGRLILALCLLVPASGAIALSYAYFQRHSFWQLAVGFVAPNTLFLMGFMNFQLAIGTALWGAAAWIHYRERYPAVTVVGSVLIATLTFFFHLVGFCFYALLIGSYELSVILHRVVRTPPALRYGVVRGLVLAIPLVVPAILYALSPLGKLNGTVFRGGLYRKAAMSLVPFLSYSVRLDGLLVLPVLAFLITCMIAGRARVSRAALICSVILLAGYFVLPGEMKGGGWVDSRVPVLLGFMIFAGFLPRGLSPRQQSAATAFLAALFLARIAFLTTVWIHAQQDIADVRWVIAAVTPGSRVLDVDVFDNPAWLKSMPISRRIPLLNQTYYHLASFVLLDRHALWPNMFTMETQQAIRVKEPYRDILGANAPPPNYAELARLPVPPEESARYPFLVDWSRKFDFVLVLNAEGARNLDTFLPDRLELLARRGIAALFKVRR
jgi:hypothetical protein